MGRRSGRAARAIARGARAALALILLAATSTAQAPTARELWSELAESFGAGRHEDVVARWQEVRAELDTTERDWPYAALLAGESMLRLGLWEDCHALLESMQTELARPAASVKCRLVAMVGRLHLAEGRFDLARPWIESALELSERVRELGEWAWSAVRYAHLRAAELELAFERADRVESLVASFLADEELYAGEPLLRAELRLDLATAQENREVGDPRVPAKARGTLRLASEELRGLSPSAERDRLLARVELALARLEIADGELEASSARLLEAARLLVDDAEGAALNERALLATLEARHALARGAERSVLEQARRALAEAFEGRVARLARLPERPGGLGLLSYVELRAPLVELARLDVALDGADAGAGRGLRRVFELQALSSLSRSVRAGVPTLAEVRRGLLAEGAGMLVFLPTARRSLVFAVDRDQVSCEELPGLDPMKRALDRHRGALLAGLPGEPGDPDDQDARADALAAEREAAGDLARLLLPPPVVERLRRWRSVTVSGLDLLGPVAVGWLPVGDAPHLGTTVAWDMLPSVPFGVARASASPPEARPRAELLLVGGVRPSEAVLEGHPELAPLPLPTRTAEALARCYASHAELEAERATPSGVLEQATRHAVVQLLVHAIRDADRPRPTGFVLEADGDDPGVLWADAVAARRFEAGAPRLAVLASCRSAQGPRRRGDAGSADMGGAWLAAGVPAVLVSHTDVTWGPTVELSEAFHAHLRGEGVSPAEALRRALAEARTDDARELPFRFGQLEVVGLGQRPVFDAGVTRAPPPWRSR